MLDAQHQCANNLSVIFNSPDNGCIRPLQDTPPEIKQAVEDYAAAMEYCRKETALLIVCYFIVHTNDR